MVNDEEYYDDIEKLYAEKKDADIDAILDFCDKYDGKLGVQHIPDLMKLFYGGFAVSEQNESIVNMLNTIVEMFGQKAVNIIVNKTDILIAEKSVKCVHLILPMILFWNSELKLDIITPLTMSSEDIKKIYKECVHENIEYVSGSKKELLQNLENKL